MAVHAASRGASNVRDRFLEWCATDPEYANEAEEMMNRLRYDSFRLAVNQGGRNAHKDLPATRDQGVDHSCGV